MNDLSYVIEKSTLSTYDDDIQIFYTDNELCKVEERISNDLISADIRFARSGMRSSSKYQAMVLGKDKVTDEPMFKCKESQLPISNIMELLGVTIDEKLNFEKHIAKICRKVKQKGCRNCSLFRLEGIFTKLLFYCSNTWHFCIKILVEMVSKQALRFVKLEISHRLIRNFVSVSVSQVFVNND